MGLMTLAAKAQGSRFPVDPAIFLPLYCIEEDKIIRDVPSGPFSIAADQYEPGIRSHL